METKNQHTDSITFLGTGGARIMVTSQILASGGLWLNLNGTEILLDPGPGCIIQSTKRKLQAKRLSAIILSHRHLDHSADTNIMVEAMTQGGFKKNGQFFAPADALDGEPVLFSYLKEYLECVQILKEGKSYSIGKISFTTPVRHIHPVETYGMVFHTADYTFSYITDTRYFDNLSRKYCGQLLIINVVFLEHLPIDHLAIPDARQIIMALKPKIAIITHFSMRTWQAKPRKIAEQLSRETGIKVIAAQDGMKFDLSLLK